MFSKNIKFPSAENEVLEYWKANNSYEQCKELSENRPRFTFYDGPPFATGLPHYGHILSGTIKDMIGRFMFQQGFRVDRRFGWDCHGLPVEYEIDKKFGFTDRRQILEMGIAKYNEECKSIVMSYSNEWEETVNRMGRWVDFKSGYKTMDSSFMESTWFLFKQLFDRNKIYRGYRVMPFSTACKTPLSNFEAHQNYKDVSDPSIIVTFPLVNELHGMRVEALVWTTTPWTLPSNCALVINPALEYVITEMKGKFYLIHENRFSSYFKDMKVVKKIPGKELLDLSYSQPFDFFEEYREKGYFKIISGDFVSDQNGTAIVHCAPAFGEDDYRAFVENGLIKENDEVPCPIDENGHFTLDKYRGIYFKDLDKIVLTEIKESILINNRMVHSYPFCWRSDTPLIYKLVPSWFIKVKDSREALLKNNEKINWVPADIKYKRFHNWLENARDWAVGRNRFWGTPIPIWITEDFQESICVGSIEELEKFSGIKVKDLHRQYIDDIIIKKDGKVFKRVEEVLDCWFESGSMPYAQDHWPFSDDPNSKCECHSCRLKTHNKSSNNIQSALSNISLDDSNLNYLKKDNFPADFIGEGIDQTRGWFYTLHVISTLLFNEPAFKNIICFGIVLAEDGKKMSKRLKNYPAPKKIFDEYGADALRLYLISSPVVVADNLRFSESGVSDVLKTLLIPWYNSLGFYKDCSTDSENEVQTEMDDWIKSSFSKFCNNVTDSTKNYKLTGILGYALKFIDDLSNWYIRMNRRHLRTSASLLKHLLKDFSIVMAPFTPFFSEYCYQSITNGGSVHHCLYPKYGVHNHPFDKAKEVIEGIRQVRESLKLKLKRPIKKVFLVLSDAQKEVLKEFQGVIESECNIIEVIFEHEDNYKYEYAVKPFFANLKKDPETMKIKMVGISKLNKDDIKQLLKVPLIRNDAVINVSDVLIEKKFVDTQDAYSFENFGLIFDLSIDEEVIERGEAREFFSFIQKLRKSSGLVVSDKINVCIDDPKLMEITQKYHPSVSFGKFGAKIVESEYVFDDKTLNLSLFIIK